MPATSAGMTVLFQALTVGEKMATGLVIDQCPNRRGPDPACSVASSFFSSTN
jgi:hypothetical protein